MADITVSPSSWYDYTLACQIYRPSQSTHRPADCAWAPPVADWLEVFMFASHSQNQGWVHTQDGQLADCDEIFNDNVEIPQMLLR